MPLSRVKGELKQEPRYFDPIEIYFFWNAALHDCQHLALSDVLRNNLMKTKICPTTKKRKKRKRKERKVKRKENKPMNTLHC